MDDNTPPRSAPETPNQNVAAEHPLLIKKQRSGGKKRVFIGLIAALVLVAGGAVAWAVLGNKQTPGSQTNTPAQQTTATAGTYDRIAYAHSTIAGGTNDSDCAKNTTKLYWRPINGGERTEASALQDSHYVADVDTRDNVIAFATAPGCGSASGTALRISTDGGGSYHTAYQDATPPSDSTQADQVISVAITTDKKAVYFSIWGNDNTSAIKKYDVASKKTTDVFDAERAIFIGAANATNVYYFAGCYGCDGNRFNTLLAYSLTDKRTSTIYDDSTNVGVETVFNNDATKLVRLVGVQGDFLGGGPPYTVEERDLTTGAARQLDDLGDVRVIGSLAYAADNTTIYYSDDTKLLSVDASNIKKTIFTAFKPISTIVYVTDDILLLSTVDDPENGDFSLVRVERATDKTSTVFSGDSNTRVFGATKSQ